MSRTWATFRPNRLRVLAARLKAHRLAALVDTGAARSLIAPTVATDFGLRLVGTGAIIGVTGVATTVPLVEVIGVGIGDIELLPFQAGILELSHLRFGILAVLGINAFAGKR